MANPRKPTALRVIEGNPGKRALPKNEPKPAVSRSAAPEHLSREAKTEWRRVIAELTMLGVMTKLDRAALAAYCQAYGRWIQAERALARLAERDEASHGLLIKTSNGNVVQSPLVGAANRAMVIMLRAAAEFGMTPAARARVETDRLPPIGAPQHAGTGRFF